MLRSRGACQGGLQARSPPRTIPFRILPCVCSWGRRPWTSWAKASSRRIFQQTNAAQGLEQTNVGACPMQACAQHYHNSDRHAHNCFQEGAFGRGRRLACPLAEACAHMDAWCPSGTLSEGVERAVHRGNSGVIQRSFGGIRILWREFGCLDLFCDVAVHMKRALQRPPK